MKHLSLAGVRTALIIAPHPDDETIGAYGLVAALGVRAARIRVVVVTDGAGSHRNSPRWPRSRLVAERRRETLRAMRRVGVCAAHIAFLGLPDGALTERAGEVRTALRRAAARNGKCDLLVLPAHDDDHPDHRAVCAAFGRRGGRRLQYLVWPSRVAASRRASHFLPMGPLAPAKRGAIRRYRTQMGAITDDPGGFAISGNELAGFARAVERFREIRR